MDCGALEAELLAPGVDEVHIVGGALSVRGDEVARLTKDRRTVLSIDARDERMGPAILGGG